MKWVESKLLMKVTYLLRLSMFNSFSAFPFSCLIFFAAAVQFKNSRESSNESWTPYHGVSKYARSLKFFLEVFTQIKVHYFWTFLQFLVEELLSQLVVLERNHHPFYSVQAFMDKNAYSEWVIVEKEKIEGLIRSFWHYSRPPVRELPLESPEFHKQYVELMKRLVR